MTDVEYQPPAVPDLLARLTREGELLAEAAARAGMDAPVPACPGWRVRDLVTHTGFVHRWAAAVVRERRQRAGPGESEAEVLRRGPADEALAGWFREGHAALVAALSEADPGLACWAFLPAPSPLAFWARRQAHETAIHRVDAEQAASAAGGAEPVTEVPAWFAADGVDELIMGFLGRDLAAGRWALPEGVLTIHAEDSPAGPHWWRVGTVAGSGTLRRGRGAGGTCELSGQAGALYLSLWNRAPASAPRITGDDTLLAALRAALAVTWD